MANFATNDHTMVIVGKTGNALTGTTINTLADGEVRCFSPGGTLKTEGTIVNEEFVIAMGRGTSDTPLVSQKIKKDWVTRISKKDYAADTQQVDYIGYTGTTGSIAVSNNTVYRATINMIEGNDTNHGGVYVKDLVYESDSAATQAEIAIGLTGSGINSFDREVKNSSGNAPIMFAALCNEGVTTANCFDNDATVTKGSKVFSVSTNLQYNSGAGTAAVGDFVRLGTAAGAVGATALGSDVYRIESISSTFVTVDRPIQVASGTYTAAGNMAEVLTAAEGAAANWGIELAGQDLDWKLGKINDRLVKWDLKLDSDAFGATTLTNSAVATLGTGTYNQVADLEWWAMGNNGEAFRKGEPNIYSYTPMAASGSTYDIITIEMEKGRNDSLGYVNSPQVIHLAIPTGGTAGGWTLSTVSNATPDVIEDLLDGVPAYTTANSFDGTALTGGDLVTD